MRPLAGVTVLDLTSVLAGPFCCHQLAHFGADMIKVEMPGRGDLARQLGADPGRNDALMGVSFLAQNAGNRSITPNLKDERGKALCATSRPGPTCWSRTSARRHGPPRRRLRELAGGQPATHLLRHLRLRPGRPLRDLPAYDQIIQGMSGIMSITGEPDSLPTRVGYLCDTIGGLTAAFDGATAVIFAELSFPAPLARGLFCLSRAVGHLAHASEQQRQGDRNKGPKPPQYRWTYGGPSAQVPTSK